MVEIIAVILLNAVFWTGIGVWLYAYYSLCEYVWHLDNYRLEDRLP